MKEKVNYDNLVMAIFDAIDAEYQRLYWNKYQKEAISPFQCEKGIGYYKNDVFQVESYHWDYENQINFYFKGDFLASWYKHPHRNLAFWRRGSLINAEYLNKMLNECIESLRKDFEGKKE